MQHCDGKFYLIWWTFHFGYCPFFWKHQPNVTMAANKNRKNLLFPSLNNIIFFFFSFFGSWLSLSPVLFFFFAMHVWRKILWNIYPFRERIYLPDWEIENFLYSRFWFWHLFLQKRNFVCITKDFSRCGIFSILFASWYLPMLVSFFFFY